MDIRMSGIDGLEPTRRIMAASHPPRVLILTTFDGDEYIIAALVAEASGFLLKDVASEQLPAGIRTITQGDSLLSPSVTRRLIESFIRDYPPTPQTQTCVFGAPTIRMTMLNAGSLRPLLTYNRTHKYANSQRSLFGMWVRRGGCAAVEIADGARAPVDLWPRLGAAVPRRCPATGSWLVAWPVGHDAVVGAAGAGAAALAP
jgi:CheY-like chemotaxis protein